MVSILPYLALVIGRSFLFEIWFLGLLKKTGLAAGIPAIIVVVVKIITSSLWAILLFSPTLLVLIL